MFNKMWRDTVLSSRNELQSLCSAHDVLYCCPEEFKRMRGQSRLLVSYVFSASDKFMWLGFIETAFKWEIVEINSGVLEKNSPFCSIFLPKFGFKFSEQPFGEKKMSPWRSFSRSGKGLPNFASDEGPVVSLHRRERKWRRKKISIETRFRSSFVFIQERYVENFLSSLSL